MTEPDWERHLNRVTGDGSNSQMRVGISAENKIFTGKFFHFMRVGISFKNCVFEDNMSFSPSTINSDMHISDCEFKKGLYLGAMVSDKKISFLNCSIENEAAIFGDIKIERLDLNLTFAKQIILSDDANINFIQIGGINRNKFDKISLNLGGVQKRIEINHTSIKNLYFGRSTLTAELAVVNSHVKEITLDNFRNDGTVKFLNCRSSRVSISGTGSGCGSQALYKATS